MKIRFQKKLPKLLLFIIGLQSVISENQCGLGCLNCSLDSLNNTPLKCTSCYDGYTLDNSSSLCVYSKCSPNLYFQVKENQTNDSEGNCISICNPLYQGDFRSNVCNKLIECSSSFQTQSNILISGLPLEIILYQEKYYIIFQLSYLSVFERNSVSLIKHLQYSEDDLRIQNVNGTILALKKDNSIEIWDIINEARLQIFNSMDLQINQQTQLIILSNQYILVSFEVESTVTLQICYDMNIKRPLQSNVIVINKNGSNLLFTNEIIVFKNNLNLSLKKIEILNGSPLQIQLSEQTLCENQQQGNFKSLLTTSSSDTYFLIYDNGIISVTQKEKKCQLALEQENIQKASIIEVGNQQITFHLIILTQQQLIDFNFKETTSVIIKDNINNEILDFEVGRFLGSNNQLIILSSQMKLEIFNYDLNNSIFIKFTTSNFLIQTIQSLKKIIIHYSNQLLQESQTGYEIALLSSQIQIIREDASTPLQLESKIITNYNIPFPTPNSQINSLVLVYSPSLLITCHQNGDIIFYDNSVGIEIQLINKMEFNSFSCQKLERFPNNKIVALLNQQLLLINPYLQIVEASINDISSDTQITANSEYLAINYSNCIQIISQEFISVFKQCETSFSSNNVRIALNNDLKLITQKSQVISIYQINLQTQSVILASTLPNLNQITFFNSISTFGTENDSINNSYVIDEIVIYDDQHNFQIYNFSLQLVHQVQNIALNSVLQAKRVTNDNSVYFLIGKSATANPVMKIHAITKAKNVSYLINTFPFSPYLDEAEKKVNGNGSVFYHIKHIMQLNFFTLHKEYIIDFNRNITYVYSHDYILGATQTSQVKKFIGSTNNYVDYVGTDKGLACSSKYQKNRYKILSTQNVLSQTDPSDQINEIVQSAQIGMYFVRTNQKITAFNIFTNDFIEELAPQSISDSRFTSLDKLSEIESVVCWNSKQILLATYGDVNQKYYYKGMTMIKGWLYNSSNKQFYLYGSSLQKLDIQFNIILSISDQTSGLTFQQCLNTQNSIICSNSSTQFVVIDKSTDKITQTTQVIGFSKQFRIGIDEDYKNIYLYDVSIQVYSLSGIFKQNIPQNGNTLNTFAIHSSYIALFSKSAGVFLNRSNLSVYPNIYAPSGLNIIKYIYVDQLKQLLFYCDNTLFAQQLVGKLSGSFAINQIGLVVGIDYDESSTYVQYLDEQGNYYIFALFDDIALYNNFKLTEVVDRKESLQGFSYNNKLNNVLAYSKNSIYQIDYTLVGLKYQYGLYESEDLFVAIPISRQEIEFLIFNKDNNLFRYSKLKMVYETTITGSKIKDIDYDTDNDVLIIGLLDSILFYSNYQQSITNNKISETFTLKKIQFQKFLSQNVYLTFDKKILHCDTLTGNIIHSIQLDQQIFVIKVESNQNKDILLIGLSNGQLLQYNLKDKTEKYYGISSTSKLNLSVIVINIDDENQSEQKAYFVTNGGIVILIDITNQQQLKEIDLMQIVNQDPSTTIGDFLYDKKFQRIVFFFNGEKKVYVWNLLTNLQEQYLILTSDQGNKLKISNSNIFTSCSFQINVYTLDKRIKLLTTIQRNNYLDQITDYKVINNNIIAIFFSEKYEIFLIQKNKNILISQQTYSYPRFLGYVFSQETNIIKIYGLHSTGVFENNYSLNTYKDNTISKCSSLIDSTDLIKAKQLITSISPKKTEVYSTNGRSITNQSNWKNIIYLQIQGEQFQSINQFISQPSFSNIDIILSPQDSLQNQLQVTIDTLSSFQQPTFQLNNYSLNFINDSNQEQQITLNENVQKIIWQNISIRQQSISQVEIKMQNMKQIILNSIKISQISNNSIEQQQNNLFTISDVDEVFIYDLDISENQISTFSLKTLFAFNNVKSVLINGLKIQNNINLSSYFSFSLVNKIKITNAQIINNGNQEQFLARQLLQVLNMEAIQNMSIFRFFGCEEIVISEIQVENNTEQSIIQSFSSYMKNNQLVTLIDDKIILSNSKIHSNMNSKKLLILIKNSNVEIDGLAYLLNQGSFIIDSSEIVNIQKSQFTGNIAQNGGAIYFRSIQDSVSFQQSTFSNNKAKSSGGSFYFENLGDCKIEFDNQTQVINNKSLIGGGIRLVQSDSNPIKLPQNYPFVENVKNNNAEIYGNDSTTYLQQLIVEDLNDPSMKTNYKFVNINNKQLFPMSLDYSKYVDIQEFQSGDNLRLRIFIIDNYNRQLTFSKENLINGLYPNDVLEELKNIQILIENLKIKESQLLGEKILNYNQYDTQSQSYQLRYLQVQGSLKTQQFFSLNSNIYLNSQTRQPVLIGIQFRYCQLGEIIQVINENIMVCKICSEGSYSLIDPQVLYQSSQKIIINQLKNECNPCPPSAQKCFGSNIQLKNGYWRQNNYSEEILQCNTKINSCQSQNINSIQGCQEGYMGPLCEQCDITGEIWNQTNKRYSEAVQKGFCQECYKTSIQWLYIILKVLVMIGYFISTLKVFIDSFIFSQTCYYLRIIKLLPISKNSIQDYSGFYIKIIINFLQISSLLIPQPKVLPLNFNILNDVIGSSNRQLSLGIDCMMSEGILRKVGKIVMHAIIQFLIPIIFIAIVLVILKIISIISKVKFKRHIYITFLQIHFTFFQLEQISYFSKSLTCRQIGSNSYNPYDLNVDCNDSDINQFNYPFSTIILFFWSLLPLIFLKQLGKQKLKLDQCNVKYNFGYFYGELKSKYYYWEFIRMYVKLAIIYVHILLNQIYESTSIVAIILILAIYVKVVSQVKPFISTSITNSEIISYSIIIFKIFLVVIQRDEGNTQMYIEILASLLDYSFVLYLCILIFIFKANNRQSIAGKIFRKILIRILPNSLFLRITNLKNIKFKTYIHWKFIYFNLQNIIHLQANQNINTIKMKHIENPNKLSSFQQDSQGKLFGQFNIFSQQSTPQSGALLAKKANRFQLYKVANTEINEHDQVIESEYQQQTEEIDPKKIESYCFSSKNSVLSSPKNYDTLYYQNILK